MRVVRLLALVLIGALAVAAPTVAQVTTGTIVGTVTDSGGVVPGATVTIRNVNRGTTTTFSTDGAGTYTAPFLVPGTYAIEVEMQGFKKWVRSDIVLEVNQRARVDVLLEVGTLEETTIVVASAPLLRTESARQSRRRRFESCRSTLATSRRWSTSSPASLPDRPARTSLGRAPSTPAVLPISTRSAIRPTPTAG